MMTICSRVLTLNPFVINNAQLSPFLSNNAFVATVVPMRIDSIRTEKHCV